MAKAKTKSHKPAVFGKETGFVANMKALATENAPNNLLYELALKHFHCDNPSPTATEDFAKELRKRIRMRELDRALEMKGLNY